MYRILKQPIEKAGKFDRIQSVWVKINVILTIGIVGNVCFYFTLGERYAASALWVMFVAFKLGFGCDSVRFVIVQGFVGRSLKNMTQEIVNSECEKALQHWIPVDSHVGDTCVV